MKQYVFVSPEYEIIAEIVADSHDEAIRKGRLDPKRSSVYFIAERSADRIFQSFRMRHNLSQRGMAKLMGVNLRTVQRWETGERIPGNETFTLLAGLDNPTYSA